MSCVKFKHYKNLSYGVLGWHEILLVFLIGLFHFFTYIYIFMFYEKMHYLEEEKSVN